MSLIKHPFIRWIGLAAVLAASLFGCKKSEKMPEDMVAQVNDHYLRLKQVEKSVH